MVDATEEANRSEPETLYVDEKIKQRIYELQEEPSIRNFHIILHRREDGDLNGTIKRGRCTGWYERAEGHVSLSRFVFDAPALPDEYEEWWGEMAFDAAKDTRGELELVIE